MKVSCPECGSKNVFCMENGVDVNSIVNKDSVNGDLFRCKDCKEVFVTGLGTRAKEEWKEAE